MKMKIRGAVLKPRLLFIEENFGLGALDKVLEVLPETDRSLLQKIILHAGWYPFEVSERLDKAIVDVLGKGDRKIFEDIGRKSAHANLTGVHKTFLLAGNPQAFLEQAKTIYKFYYDTGNREYRSTGPQSGTLTTHDAESFSRAECLTVIGWHKEALEMCGAKNVSISETKCRAKGDPVCEYELAWDL
jgi:uncharacterized protein (TIGR02265 family)